MDLTSLDIFLAVAGEGSVTRAAKAVCRAPSNVTVRIQQLEQELGVPLFCRDGKKMTLTREGRTFVSYANRLTALALAAKDAVRPSAPLGSLRLGSMESTAAGRLPDALARFARQWPFISLQLSMGASQDLVDDVLSNTLDCALIARPTDPRQTDAGPMIDPDRLVAERVFVEELLIVLPPSHPAIQAPADLRIDVLCALETGCTYRRIAEAWARGAPSLRTREVGSYHAILASVTTGNAIGVMPKSVLALMRWPVRVRTHSLGLVDTLLVRRSDHRPDSFNALLDVLAAGEGTEMAGERMP